MGATPPRSHSTFIVEPGLLVLFRVPPPAGHSACLLPRHRQGGDPGAKGGWAQGGPGSSGGHYEEGSAYSSWQTARRPWAPFRLHTHTMEKDTL